MDWLENNGNQLILFNLICRRYFKNEWLHFSFFHIFYMLTFKLQLSTLNLFNHAVFLRILKICINDLLNCITYPNNDINILTHMWNSKCPNNFPPIYEFKILWKTSWSLFILLRLLNTVKLATPTPKHYIALSDSRL